jgi:MFS family permease
MRRPWILAGCVGAFCCLVAIGLATSVWVILIAWCGAQTFSNFAQGAESATIPDQVPAQRRGFVSGVVGACTPVAILLGAVFLAMFKTDLPRFAVPAGIGLVFGLLFFFTLKDRVLKQKPSNKLSIVEFLTSFVFNPKKYPDLGWAWLTKFLVMFGYASVGTYLTLFLAAKFGMNTQEQATFNMYANFISVGCMVVVSVFSGKMSDKVGKRRPFVATGGILIALGLLAIAVSPLFGQAGLTLILCSEAVLGIGTGLFLAVDMALCTQVLPNPEDTAKDLGVLNIANALPQSLAPMMAGPVIVAVGSLGYTVWFGFGALVALSGGALIYKIKGVK